MKTKVSWKLFALAILIIVGSTGFLYNELKATNKTVSAVDKKLEGVSVRQEIFEINAVQSLSEIKSQLQTLNDNVNNHIQDWRKSNGMKKKEE